MGARQKENGEKIKKETHHAGVIGGKELPGFPCIAQEGTSHTVFLLFQPGEAA